MANGYISNTVYISDTTPTPLQIPDDTTDLSVSKCLTITILPEFPISLFNIYINDCPLLTKIPEFPKSLIKLEIINCPLLTVLPQLPNTLQYFNMESCPLITSSQDIGYNFKDLTHCTLYGCPLLCGFNPGDVINKNVRSRCPIDAEVNPMVTSRYNASGREGAQRYTDKIFVEKNHDTIYYPSSYGLYNLLDYYRKNIANIKRVIEENNNDNVANDDSMVVITAVVVAVVTIMVTITFILFKN